MSKYLVLIYEDEQSYASATPDVFGDIAAAHTKFGEANRGAILGGEALQSTATATVIRADDAGGHIVTDGAYAETKEALGGYYLIEAADLDAALAVAKEVPARFGCVEVRPVMVFD
jgi:hypothetical protein